MRRQFTLGLLDEGSTVKPDYARCVEIVTRSSLRQMIAPVWLPMQSTEIGGDRAKGSALVYHET